MTKALDLVQSLPGDWSICPFLRSGMALDRSRSHGTLQRTVQSEDAGWSLPTYLFHTQARYLGNEKESETLKLGELNKYSYIAANSACLWNRGT